MHARLLECQSRTDEVGKITRVNRTVKLKLKIRLVFQNKNGITSQP